MSHFLDRLSFFARAKPQFSDGHGVTTSEDRSWEDGYRKRWQHDKIVRSTHGVNCTGSCSWKVYVKGGIVGWFTKIMGVIPVQPSEGPKSILRSLETARQCVQNGELVCIFAEGSLTRTGQLQPFQRGLLKIVEGTSAPVIPVYLDGLWGSIFSFFQGRYFWKLPRKWPYPVGILFGPAIREPDNVHAVRQAVQDLGVEAMEYRKQSELNLPRMFLRMCRKTLTQPKVADSSGQELTGGQLLLRTLILARLVARHVLAADEKVVGVLLPPSVGGVLVNAALPLAGRRVQFRFQQ